ncbi:type IV conjugative transfer system pilin TraA [Gilliamella sp. BG7]|uniref:type IV conjugative transfer system pilin TraA n=1 Tax=unclassified Gilliamella TaxID=2685620 RepID=UPI0039866BB3
MTKNFYLLKNIDYKKVFLPFFALLALVVYFTAPAYADDLLSSGDTVVKDTLGKDSSLVKWIYIVEVLAGLWAFVKTKNLVVLLGFVALIVGTSVAFSAIGV